MSDTLIGVSPDYLYYHKKPPKPISELHKPYFLVFCQKNEELEKNRQDLIKKLETNNSETDPLSKIESIGGVEDYKSFWDFTKKRKVFKVYTKKSYFVPEVSDHLFFNYSFYTAEHDVPYHQRALLDLAANGTAWLFDTNNEKKKLKILVYDIETTEYEEGKTEVPIDIIGYSSFDLVFESNKNLEKEEFSFNILDVPSNWEDLEVKQLVSHNIDEEVKNLYDICKILGSCDIVSGHNIVGFDNFYLYGRIDWILKNYRENLSEDEKKIFQCFIKKYCRLDKSFHFGVGSEVVQFYPTCFDTYLAARKFYSFLDEFSLKTLAPFLGVVVKDRVFLSPSQIRIDARTLKYNKQDVQEQLGVTLNLIQQALPLAFITCMPFDMLLPTGAVNMWDHMALLRGVVQKKIMPPICRVKSISQVLVRDFNGCKTREDIIKQAKKKREQLSKDFVRILKYGDEMPEWVEYPYIIYNEQAVDEEESLSYHIPGGMTIKPDKEAHSDFIPWYHVVVADVGAMYPTILKAMNIGADTVKLASKKDKPDAYIWLKKLPERFFENRDVFWRGINPEDSYADKGYILGIKIDNSPGVVNNAMTGIMNIIAKIKKELKEMGKKNDKAELHRLKMMYQSMKGVRNAGSHGILSAPTVTGRQFNLWGAAAITTKGQMILADTLKHLENKKIRVVYGDTDGIYIGCSRSASNLPNFSKTLKVPQNPDEKFWLTKPEIAIAAIEECDKKWQKDLNYPDFELEPEIYDCMIFVKHKNYLIFNEKDGKIEMITKGNNFKGSDKANIARKVLEEIMMLVLKENPCWDEEEKARCAVKNSIKNKTREVLSRLDLSRVDLDDLTLVQSVQPSKRYKTIQDGSASVFGKRSAVLEKLLGQPIRTRIKLRFVVTKKPLPGIPNPSKSGVKPIDYMYPVDLLKNTNEIDLEWYKKMIENYIQGAFGFSNISATEQKGLDAWM